MKFKPVGKAFHLTDKLPRNAGYCSVCSYLKLRVLAKCAEVETGVKNWSEIGSQFAEVKYPVYPRKAPD